MNPQPPVTKCALRQIAATRRASRIRAHTKDTKVTTVCNVSENEIAKQILNNVQLDDAETPDISL